MNPLKKYKIYEGLRPKETAFNLGEILTKNNIYNFVYGMRDAGKSFTGKMHSVDNFLLTGKKFIWLRRYNSEINKPKGRGGVSMCKTWASEIQPFYRCKIESGTFGIKIDGEHAGDFLALNTGLKDKSINLKEYNRLIFDEFILKKGVFPRYLKDEINVFFSLIDSLFRTRRDHRIIAFANADDYFNPYFLHFKVPDIQPCKFHVLKQKSLLFYNYFNQKLYDEIQNSPIGKLTEGSEYNEYAYKNKFIDRKFDFIATKSNKAEIIFSIIWDKRIFSLWHDRYTGSLYMLNGTNASSPVTYSLKTAEHGINTFLIKNKRASFLTAIADYFAAGKLFFENEEVKYFGYEILEKFI